MNKHGNQKIKTYSRPIKATASNKQAIHRQPHKRVIKSALKKNNILVDIRGEKVCGCGKYCSGCYGRQN